jgi:hypothetical protein
MASTFKNFTARSIGTTANAVYNPTTSNIQSTIIGMTIANIGTTTIAVNVYLNESSANTYLIKNALVPVGGTLVPIGGEQKLVVEQNNTLYVSSNTASSADVILSVLEIT